MTQVAIKNCTFKFKDGAAHELEFKIGDGGLGFRCRRNIIFRKNRGKLDLVLLGDQVPLEVNFEVTIEFLKSLSGASAVTPYEFLKKILAAASYTTVGPDCEPYAINVEIKNDAPCASDTPETITLQVFRPDKVDGGVRDATLKVTGRCNQTFPDVVRS